MTSMSNVSAQVYLEHSNKALEESDHGDKAEKLVGQRCG